MVLWLLILINVFYAYGQIRESEYECGVHGRFEYCIDGIPGCVIGCHCHPGFYFDTDTKICEPNIKLTQHFRRQYEYLEPTRANYGPPPTEVDETTTIKKNTVDEKVDEMTKDVDDLGDWLYNQFFKTIENQVINETKDDTSLTKDKSIISRRSGSDPTFLEKPSRRSHKYWKARKKKKRKKKKGLKSKLLRITEDDSLFDSSSGSTSDESSDSSDSSSESESDDSRDSRKKKGNDHGHKKIIVMNKRPRPPLPSFIFLPNMETPFFPPIGLPPPAMPMYPMVPVPPMMPPFYPFPGVTPHSNGDCGETTTSESSTIDTTNDHSTNGHATNGHDTNGHDSNGHATNGHSTNGNADNDYTTNAHVNSGESTTITTENDAPEESTEIPSAEGNKDEEGAPETPPALRNRMKSRKGPRHKLMQKLREKIKRKNKLQNHFVNQYYGPEPPFADVDATLDRIPLVPSRHKSLLPQINIPEELQGQLSGLQDVDFKYLSQLIHKADLSKTSQPTSPSNQPMEIAFTQSSPSRRNYYDKYPNDITQVLNNLANQPVNHVPNLPINNVPNQPNYKLPYRKKIENTNDTYYANLGRQIASMIRNIDADKDVDIEIEKTNAKSQSDSVFNGNSYGSRSYWERSIRSPFKYLINSLKNEMNYLKKSNENLFSLENQVEIAASTEPTLGLRELENIISQMEKAKSKLVRKHEKFNHAEPSRTSLNVNLLPVNNQSFYSEEPHSNFAKLYSSNLSTSKRKQNNPASKPKYENKNTKWQYLYPLLKSEYKNTNTRRQNVQKQLEPVIMNFNTMTQNFPSHIEPKDMLESPFHTVSKDTLQPSSLKPKIKSSEEPPFPPKLKNKLFGQFYNLIPETFINNTDPIDNNFQNILPTRKPHTFLEPHYEIPNNIFKSYAYTVLPLPQKLLVPQKPPIITSLNVPLMSVTTSRTYYQQLRPMVVHQNNLNYYSGNNNPYLFEKASIPLKFRAFSNRLAPLEERVEPSYFHHEVHHFDYFDM